MQHIFAEVRRSHSARLQLFAETTNLKLLFNFPYHTTVHFLSDGVNSAAQTITDSHPCKNSSAALPRRGFDLTSSAFLIVAFLTGIAGALQTPTLSLFLTNEVHVRPAMVGFFFTGSAVIGILVSQFLAGRSDRQGDRKQLIVFCCLLGVLACLLFAWNRNYFILLFVGVFLSSFGSTANPQMFALAREHADKTGREAVMFSSILRAQVSLAWGDRPAAGLRAGNGVRLYRDVSLRRGRLCGLRGDGVVLFCPVCAKRSWRRQVIWKRRALTAAMRCCCSASVH
ncbi:Sugar efflux transporter B [Raoultella planticola]|nr:Sugar efflux transporter B [Raoultella planticola]